MERARRNFNRGVGIVGHEEVGIAQRVADRFWGLVDKSNPCWVWRGQVDHGGYGKFVGHKKDGTRKSFLAHRLAYRLVRGPVDSSLELDHTCKNILCVNPEHLDPVTPAENNRRSNSASAVNARKTHCKRGHPLFGNNLYRWRKARSCRTCRSLSKRGKL